MNETRSAVGEENLLSFDKLFHFSASPFNADSLWKKLRNVDQNNSGK